MAAICSLLSIPSMIFLAVNGLLFGNPFHQVVFHCGVQDIQIKVLSFHFQTPQKKRFMKYL
jgi:hypothetical protein